MPVKMQVVSKTICMNVDNAKFVYLGGEPYTGTYDITPSTKTNQVLETAHKFLSENVNVKKIPYSQTGNPSGGNTVYIGSDEEITT